MCAKSSRILFVMFACSNFFMCESEHNLLKCSLTKSQNKFQAKIVNGQVVSIKKYPFAVQFLNMGRLCGGVIIHSWAIVTAGHCLAFSSNTKEMLIQTGAKYAFDSNSVKYNVQSFVIHENYSKEQAFSCDIALVFPEKPIQFGPRAKKAILVDHDRWMVETESSKFIVMGWGHTQEHGEVSKVGLQMTTLKYVPPDKCSRLHNNYTFTADMFCLYGDGITDVCQGDSGGGVLWNDMLVGLTSHGKGCAIKNKPTVYANLWVLRNWIEDHFLEFYNNNCVEKFRRKDNYRNKTNFVSL